MDNMDLKAINYFFKYMQHCHSFLFFFFYFRHFIFFLDTSLSLFNSASLRLHTVTQKMLPVFQFHATFFSLCSINIKLLSSLLKKGYLHTSTSSSYFLLDFPIVMPFCLYSPLPILANCG